MKALSQQNVVIRLVLIMAAAMLLSCGSDEPTKTGSAEPDTNKAFSLTVQRLDKGLSFDMALGTSQQLVAVANWFGLEDKYFTHGARWSSSDEAVAAVSKSGMVSAVGTGSATITAIWGRTAATVTITVRQLSSIQVLPASASIAMGLTQQYTALGLYSDGTTQDITDSVTWSSSGPEASISASALATGIEVGTVSIVATFQSIGLTSSASGQDGVLAVTPAEMVSISLTSDTGGFSMANATTRQFRATGIYTDEGMRDLTSLVKWNSSDPHVLSIGFSNGFAFANSIGGPVTITATDPLSGISSTADITVHGTWKLVRSEMDQGMDGDIDSVVSYEYYASPAGATTVRYGNNGLSSSIQWYIYNTTADLVQLDADNDGDMTVDLTYWFFYSAPEVRTGWVLDSVSGVDTQATLIYNSSGYKERLDIDVAPFGSINAVRNYEHDALGNLVMENYDKNLDGISEFINFYAYDESGNLTYKGVDTNDDGSLDYEESYSFTFDADGNRDTLTVDIGNDATDDDIIYYYWLFM